MTLHGNHKPPVFVQVDLDGFWAIRRCYGYPEEEAFTNDPVFSEGLPRILELFQAYGVKGTFFVTGRDLELREKVSLLKQAAEAGHEIANHSYTHFIGMSGQEKDRARSEIQRTQDKIEQELGCSSCGFRAPGYEINATVLELVYELGLKYDASFFSTPWTGLLKLIARNVIGREGAQSGQFGTHHLRKVPQVPFRLSDIDLFKSEEFNVLWEFPIPVSPRLKLPVQVSYSQLIGSWFFLGLARYHRDNLLPLSCILHGVDLVDTRLHEVLPGAGSRARLFFRLSLDRKIRSVNRILTYLSQHFSFTTPPEWISKSS